MRHNTIDKYQQELEDAFKLECTAEDIKNDKYAKQLYKKIKKQVALAKKINRLTRKFWEIKR